MISRWRPDVLHVYDPKLRREKMKKVFALVLIGFCVFSGFLVAESGLLDCCGGGGQRGVILLQRTAGTMESSSDVSADEPEVAVSPAADFDQLTVSGGPVERPTLGSVDPDTGYKFELGLHSKGASIELATFSEYDDRDYKNPLPLDFLRPIGSGLATVMSLENRGLFGLAGQDAKGNDIPYELHRLSWNYLGTKTTIEGVQRADFEALFSDSAGEPVVRLVKTYEVSRDSYLMACSLKVENLGSQSQKLRFNMGGPCGLGKEAVRMDGRRVVAGFRDGEEVISVRREMKKLKKKDVKARRLETETAGAKFLWAASTNKYFAAIVVPDANQAGELIDRVGRLYNPDGDSKRNTGDETIGMDLRFAGFELAGADEAGSSVTYDFDIYLGPKDKGLFDKNPMYSDLGFVQTIDFMACCCPPTIIKPLAFGILWVMKQMYGVIGNYGIVIIIFVFFIRLLLHPLTKKSQIQMSKFSKMAPKAEEIKKKYANNKAEMQKHMMALYKEGGSAPIMGMLPMLIQMPIWISLYSALYASIDLRGAEFLPFWITDLSVPDALIRWDAFTVPFIGWKIDSLNLLPLLMGLAFYLQQKLMPSQAAAASTNPQAAQQQKMMMVMMPIMFPLMLYKAPAGLNLYIMSSTFAGVIEQFFIRKHIREKDQAESEGRIAVTSKTGGKVKVKKPKPFIKT